MTLIHRKFFPQCDSSGQFVQMRNTTDTQTYPVVKAKIELDGHSYEIDVAVSEQLQEDALLEMDLPLMKHPIYAMNSEEKQTVREQLGPSETSYTVTTRAQAQQQKHNPPIGRKHNKYQTRAQKRAQQKQYQTQTLRFSFIMNLLSYKSRTLKFNNGNKINNLSSKHKYLDNGAIETNQLMTRWFYLNNTVNKYSN